MTNKELSAKVARARGDHTWVWYEVYNAPAGKMFKCQHCGMVHGFDYEEKPNRCKRCGHSSALIKPYATDMNAAWGLVSEIGDDVHSLKPKQSDEPFFVNNRVFVEGKYKVECFEASTMPRAICKAYLKFKGVE